MLQCAPIFQNTEQESNIICNKQQELLRIIRILCLGLPDFEKTFLNPAALRGSSLFSVARPCQVVTPPPDAGFRVLCALGRVSET